MDFFIQVKQAFLKTIPLLRHRLMPASIILGGLLIVAIVLLRLSFAPSPSEPAEVFPAITTDSEPPPPSEHGTSLHLYRSNISGMALEEIEDKENLNKEPPIPWLLRVEKKGPEESRWLLKEGKLHRKWLRLYNDEGVYSSEQTFNGENDLIRELFFTQEGQVKKEIIYQDGSPSEILLYHYGELGLETITQKDGEENILAVNYYQVRPEDGSLYRMERHVEGAPAFVQSLSRQAERAAERVQMRPESSTLTRYGKEERPLERELLNKEGEPSKKTSYAYDQQGQLRSVDTKSLQMDQIDTLSLYNSKRELIREDHSVEGVLDHSTAYTYYPDGKLRERRYTGQGGPQTWRYQYTADGELLEEVHLKGSQVVSRKEYQDPQNYDLILYTKGEPLLRVPYRDGQEGEAVSLLQENQS